MTTAEWWRCPNPACNASNHPTITVCGLCHHPKPGVQVNGSFQCGDGAGSPGEGNDNADASAMKIRAESVNVPTRVHGLTGMEWAAKVTADPMRTLPPGAGACIVRDLRAVIRAACDVIEMADARNLANDGPAGGFPPDMSLKEWQTLYEILKSALGDKV